MLTNTRFVLCSLAWNLVDVCRTVLQGSLCVKYAGWPSRESPSFTFFFSVVICCFPGGLAWLGSDTILRVYGSEFTRAGDCTEHPNGAKKTWHPGSYSEHDKPHVCHRCGKYMTTLKVGVSKHLRVTVTINSGSIHSTPPTPHELPIAVWIRWGCELSAHVRGRAECSHQTSHRRNLRIESIVSVRRCQIVCR